MKLSAQEEYGLRCLLHMAGRGPGASLSIPEISRAEGLSIPNVAKLMRLLRIGGFVHSVRGQAGGYTLARPSNELFVGAVLEMLGGRIYHARFCARHAGLEPVCNHNEDCSLRSVWASLQTVIEGVFRHMTLSDLLRSEADMKVWMQRRTQQLFPAESLGSPSLSHSA